MPSPKPFILNTETRWAHRRAGLTEECNTDQIVKRRNVKLVPQSYKRCQHCFPLRSFSTSTSATSTPTQSEESPYSESNAGFTEEPDVS